MRESDHVGKMEVEEEEVEMGSCGNGKERGVEGVRQEGKVLWRCSMGAVRWG